MTELKLAFTALLIAGLSITVIIQWLQILAITLSIFASVLAIIKHFKNKKKDGRKEE